MTKRKQAILYGVFVMAITTLIFVVLPKPVMYGKLYLQFSFLMLAELVCICSYLMLPTQARHLKTLTLVIFMTVELGFNVFLFHFMALADMIALNVVFLVLLALTLLVENYYLR